MEEFAGLYVKAEKVGSRVTCNPPPTHTDNDILVLTTYEKITELDLCLHRHGYTLGGSSINQTCAFFASYRRGTDNIIVTAEEGFYNRFLTATHIAKRLNILDKNDRIMLFQAVLYGNLI